MRENAFRPESTAGSSEANFNGSPFCFLRSEGEAQIVVGVSELVIRIEGQGGDGQAFPTIDHRVSPLFDYKLNGDWTVSSRLYLGI